MSPVNVFVAGGKPKMSTKKPKLPAIGQAQYIVFTGSLAGGNKSATQKFTVLAGDGAPTITDGYANWNTVARDQQVGMTTLAGYNPMALTVPIRFDCYQTDWLDTQNGRPNQHAFELEADIEKLDWMGGRGKLFGPSGIGIAGVGDSPLVTVASIDSQGSPTPLVPPTVHGLQWVVSAITWDPSPVRNNDGYRTRQDVTVALLEWVQDSFSASADSSSARAVATGAITDQYQVVVTTSALNTIQKIAGKYAAGNPTAPAQILAANKSNTRIGTSYTKQLPNGTRIKVPLTLIQGLS